jgi:putative spermidine/putrescine transport system ATP-binding protein
LPTSTTSLPATVTGVEYQGTYVLLTLRSPSLPGEGELNVVLSEAAFDAAPWQPGEAASAHWLASDVHALAA